MRFDRALFYMHVKEKYDREATASRGTTSSISGCVNPLLAMFSCTEPSQIANLMLSKKKRPAAEARILIISVG